MHKQEYCKQEGRISAIEERLTKKHGEIDELNHKTDKLDEAVTALKVAVTELTSTLSTIKWVIGIGVGLFAGVMVFLVTELIKLIH